MKRWGWIAAGLVVAALLAFPLSNAVRSLRMTRGAMATFTALVASANARDLDAVRSLCSTRYLGTHVIRRSPEGGVVGLPGNIHKNFQVWAEGNEVWLCPTNRVGAIYRFVMEEDVWKFDGLVGLLKAGGEVELTGEGEAADADFL